MELREFYSRLLAVASPWAVKAVSLKDEPGTVDVHLECPETAYLPCPCCDRKCPVCDYSPSKSWRHLDTCGKKTLLHARLPVVNCPEHGKQHPRVPWAGNFPPFLNLSPAVPRSAGLSGEGGRGDFAHVGQPAAPEQMSIFSQDMTFVNRGIQAFNKMELDKAVDLFKKHRNLYPKGYDISSKLKAAEFLLAGMRTTPADTGQRVGYLCRLWDLFEDHLKEENIDSSALSSGVKGSYFAEVLREVERAGPAGSTALPEDIPLGFLLLQAGRYEEAIRNLQECIAKMPHNASLFGWLADAYLLNGEPVVARHCYREACFIDPLAMDWRHVEDADLKQLKQDISFYYDPDPALALEWLPSHARIEGLFERKVVRLNEGLKEMVDDYLAVERAWSKENSPRLSAKLFLRGLVLCENLESLKFIKKIDPIQVRRTMKQANPDLFEEFLEKIVEGKK